MRSTDGAYWVALDHVRALAALLVFVWHFTHASDGYPVPFEGAPAIFPLALFDEGHTGVAVFMTLSGYIFAKLLDGKSVHYHWFIWNRVLRLVPLLAAVFALNFALVLWRGQDLSGFFASIAKGFVLPTWPNGGWSITAELHFYLVLPAILWLGRKNPGFLLLAVAAMMALRLQIFALQGTVHDAAYWTIIGRADQFLLGIFCYMRRDWIAAHARLAIPVLLAFLGGAWLFDSAGGFHALGGGYPSPSPLWVTIPTIEGAVYAFCIAAYDQRARMPDNGVSWFAAQYGKFSYSIYLLHFFVYARIAAFIDQNVTSLANFYVAFAFAVLAFLAMYPVGWLSYRFIEEPFLRLRRRYTYTPQAVPGPRAEA